VPERPRGVFVGLATLDVINRVDAGPAANQKITAREQFVAAGGPAANAAVAFAGLGGRAVLVTALGQSAIARLIASELEDHGVEVVDVTPDSSAPAPVSAVAVTIATGERSVIGADAASLVVDAPSDAEAVLDGADVVLIDGHHPLVATAFAAAAIGRGIRVVVDAGRWKPVMAELMTQADDMVCSDDFRMPGSSDSDGTAAELVAAGVDTVVTTHGDGDVLWWRDGASGSVAVPAITAADTLGAGDVFHGAYAYYSTLDSLGLPDRIRASARVAALRCSIVGPRAWLENLAELNPLEMTP